MLENLTVLVDEGDNEYKRASTRFQKKKVKVKSAINSIKKATICWVIFFLAYRNVGLFSLPGPGAHFGEFALLNDEPRMASIQCMEDCTCWTLGKADFRAEIFTRPQARHPCPSYLIGGGGGGGDLRCHQFHEWSAAFSAEFLVLCLLWAPWQRRWCGCSICIFRLTRCGSVWWRTPTIAAR